MVRFKNKYRNVVYVPLRIPCALDGGNTCVCACVCVCARGWVGEQVRVHMLYTVGAILYSFDKIKYNHAVFHFFVLAASISQFASVYFYVL